MPSFLAAVPAEPSAFSGVIGTIPASVGLGPPAVLAGFGASPAAGALLSLGGLLAVDPAYRLRQVVDQLPSWC